MYLGEVSSNELTHLDKEVTYISHMRWRGFTMLLHKGVTAAKVEAMQMWWWRGTGAHGWRQSLARVGRGACAASLLLWHLWADNLNPPQFMRLLLATSSSRCVISSPGTFSECMDDFASSQPENPCTVVPARYTLEHLELNAWRTEMSLTWRKDPPPCLTLHPTYCHYGLEHVTLFLLGMECIILPIFNKYQKLSFIPIRCGI